MPSSFVDIDRVEMEYVDGGANIAPYIATFLAGAIMAWSGKWIGASMIGVLADYVGGWVLSTINAAFWT
jgi:hypothetical protein